MYYYLSYYDLKTGRNGVRGPFLNTLDVRRCAHEIERRLRPAVLHCACLDSKRTQLFAFVVSSFLEV